MRGYARLSRSDVARANEERNEIRESCRMASDNDKRLLLNDLISVTREISEKYSGGKKVVTEEQVEVERFLNIFERILCFGLKNHSLLGNVQELFSSSSSSTNGSLFWTFAYQHLTNHERQRFSTYKNLWTDRGKTKALIRNALNERCLERYLLTWLNTENLNEYYEPFSLLRDEKAAAILPKLAGDLASILFAISIDVPELNVATSKPQASKSEPIISVPKSSEVIKSTTGTHRNIDQFEETVKATDLPVPEATSFLKLLEASSIYEYATPPESIAQFSDKISIISSESSTGSPSNLNLKDDDSISRSSSEEIQPTVSKIPDQIDTNEAIQKQHMRIMELENQIRDLTMENSRLKNLLCNNKVNSLANFQVSIPRAVLQKTKTKNFYIYEINLRSKDGGEWTIFKRYRDFHQLHKTLKKQNLQIKVLDFPPKKKIGNMNFDLVEERRQRLQVYIRHVIQMLPELASCDSRKLLEAKCEFFKA